MSPNELAVRWRSDAEVLDTYGATQLAALNRRHADDLDAALRAEQERVLTLAEAGAVSGYSPERLRHMVAEGVIANAGRKGAPRVRRGDLPIKAPKAEANSAPTRRALGFDASAVARSIRTGRAGGTHGH